MRGQHMSTPKLRSLRRIAAISVALAGTLAVGGLTESASARILAEWDVTACQTDVGTSARGGHGADHRDVSASEQKAIEAQAASLLKRKTGSAAAPSQLGGSIPVYVHVMRTASGGDDVTDTQIAQQIDVLNNTYAGGESSTAADTGFTFNLAGTYRYNNNNWNADRQSTQYRSQTRKGGADALNIWLVDFSYLGIATFPWDYSRNPSIDGIRVQYSSLPGGSATNFNLGETATHEAGHWLGLYHTFQGGCTSTNDSVSDTPAQGSASSGCPAGRDSCSLPGLDPIHNYMDYSYDSCYTEFTGGQSSRMSSMFTAYRA